MTCIGMEDGIGLLQFNQHFGVQRLMLGDAGSTKLWRWAWRGNMTEPIYAHGAYREESDGVDSQLINVGVAHDCDCERSVNGSIELFLRGGCERKVRSVEGWWGCVEAPPQIGFSQPSLATTLPLLHCISSIIHHPSPITHHPYFPSSPQHPWNPLAHSDLLAEAHKSTPAYSPRWNAGPALV